MDLDLYELSFDHLESLIRNFFLFFVPLVSASYIVIRFANKYFANKSTNRQNLYKKHSIKCLSEDLSKMSYRLPRRLDMTERTEILELLENLPSEYPEYCHVNFVTEPQSFYLINDTDLIESIRTDKSLNEVFESQLYQPYLILDSNCDLKLKKIEYEKLMKPVLKTCFENVKSDFTECLSVEFEKFLKQNKKLCQRDLFELVFKLSTIYIKKIFNLTDNDKGSSSSKNLILFNLFEIHQTFSLSLFVNSPTELVNDYTKSYKDFMKLIEQEYETQIDLVEFDLNENDTEKLKFLIIKNIYLDCLKVYSVLTWFFHEISCDESVNGKALISTIKQGKKLELEYSNHLNEMLLRSYLKILSVDLYYVNTESKIPVKFSFLQKKKLIALNIFNFVNNIEVDESFGLGFNLLDDFVQVMCHNMATFFIRNFDLKLPDVLITFQSSELYDLPLIRYFDNY